MSLMLLQAARSSNRGADAALSFDYYLKTCIPGPSLRYCLQLGIRLSFVTHHPWHFARLPVRTGRYASKRSYWRSNLMWFIVERGTWPRCALHWRFYFVGRLRLTAVRSNAPQLFKLNFQKSLWSKCAGRNCPTKHRQGLL
jgi:hypothetical protein